MDATNSTSMPIPPAATTQSVVIAPTPAAEPVISPMTVLSTFFTKLGKKIPHIVAFITIGAFVFLALAYVVLQVLPQQQAIRPTPTPTVTATIAPTDTVIPTPFPTAEVTKGFIVSLYDKNAVVRNTAEISPLGAVVSVSTVAISSHTYIKTDKQKIVTEVGQTSPDGLHFIKGTSTTIDLYSSAHPTVKFRLALAKDGQYLFGYFISDNEYAVTYLSAHCNNWDATCAKTAQSTVIYNIEAKQFHGLQNQKEGIPAIYIGSTSEYHLFTNKLNTNEQNTFLRVNRNSYDVRAVIIPPAIFSSIVWGPQLDLVQNRVWYLTKGFSDTIEIGYYDLKLNKDKTSTEFPAIVSSTTPIHGVAPGYVVHFFKNFSLAYIGATYIPTIPTSSFDEDLAHEIHRTYYYSAPDDEVKEITAIPPELKSFFFDDTPSITAYDPTTAQIALLFGVPRNILVVDTRDIAHPIGKNIPITGALPAFTIMEVSGWKN